jgi:hypothetical protein
MPKKLVTKKEFFPLRFSTEKDALEFLETRNPNLAVIPMKRVGDLVVTNSEWRDARYELTPIYCQ